MQPADLVGLPPRALRAYGKFIGNRPRIVFTLCSLVIVLLSLGWIKIGKNAREALTDAEFEEAYTVDGSEFQENVEKTIQHWKRGNKDPWFTDTHIVVLVGKGDREGADMLTQRTLKELYDLQAKYYDIEVTTSSGKTYGTYDLCARGITPDDPAKTIKMPCLVISAMDCFNDYQAFLDPNYLTNYDGAGSPFVSYRTRPALKNVTDSQVKSMLSKGCDWAFEGVKWEAALLAGGRKWKGNQMTSARSVSMLIMTDGPRRTSLRLSLTKPELADERDIIEATELHTQAWVKAVTAYNTAEKQDVEAAILRANVLPTIEKNLEDPEWWKQIMSGTLLVLYVGLALASFKSPSASRSALGIQGMCVVSWATLSAGGLFFIIGFKLNSLILAGIPFLALGLGANDMLILNRGYSELGVRKIKEETYPEIIGEVMARAGVGVTLTSLCNVVAFCLASLVPVQGVSEFCICAAIDSVMNYFAMMTIFPCCIVLDAYRVKKAMAEPSLCTVCCHRILPRDSGEEVEGSGSFVEEKLIRFLQTAVAPRLASKFGGFVMLLITLLAIGLSIPPILTKSTGYRPHEIIPTNLASHRGIELIFRDFNIFPAMLVYHDLDVASNQEEMLKLYDAVSKTKFTVNDGVPHYLTMFSYHVNSVNSSFLKAAPCAPAGSAPVGLVEPDHFNKLFSEYSTMPSDASKALTGGPFVQADMVKANQFKYNQDGSLYFSFSSFFITNTANDEDFITVIKDLEKIVETSPLKGKAYVYSDIITYWSTFLHIEGVLYQVIGIAVMASFMSALLLLQSPTSAVIVAGMSLLIVANIFAICMTFLMFNVFIVSTILASIGLSIEFTAHVASSFVLAKGTPEQRLAEVMRETYPAIVQGGVSTLLALFPMFFSKIAFVTKYVGIPFTILVFVGVFHGMIVLPSLLALSANIKGAFAQSGSGSDQDAQTPESGELPKILTKGAPQSGGKEDFDVHSGKEEVKFV